MTTTFARQSNVVRIGDLGRAIPVRRDQHDMHAVFAKCRRQPLEERSCCPARAQSGRATIRSVWRNPA